MTWDKLDNQIEYSRRMKRAEQGISQSFPISEHRYMSDPISPFKLYNCLVPVLKDRSKHPELNEAKKETNNILDQYAEFGYQID